MKPDREHAQVFVGMGITWYWANDIYAGTVTRVSDDGRTFWFKQDRPVRRAKGLGAAFIFIEGRGLEEYEARLQDDRYVLVSNGRPIDLGVRRWYCAPLNAADDSPGQREKGTLGEKLMMTCIDAESEEPYSERLPYGDHNLLPPDYLTASDEEADAPWPREADGERDVNRDE